MIDEERLEVFREFVESLDEDTEQIENTFLGEEKTVPLRSIAGFHSPRANWTPTQVEEVIQPLRHMKEQQLEMVYGLPGWSMVVLFFTITGILGLVLY